MVIILVLTLMFLTFIFAAMAIDYCDDSKVRHITLLCGVVLIVQAVVALKMAWGGV